MSQDLRQLELEIEKRGDRIAEVITPSLVRRYFPNKPKLFGEDPLTKTFDAEEVLAIDEAIRQGDTDPEMKVLSREDRSLFAENISQELLARYKRGADLTEEEGTLYWEVNQLGALRDERKKLLRTTQREIGG